MAEVYVVTNTDLWDCVIGVFNANSVSRKALEERFLYDDSPFLIHYQEVHKDLYDFIKN